MERSRRTSSASRGANGACATERSRMNHDVPSRRNLRPVAPQNFANAAANAVPHHRAAQSFLDADPEAAGAARRERSSGGTFARSFPPEGLIRKLGTRAEENGKLRARAALTGAIYGFVFDALQQAHGTRKILPWLVRRGGRSESLDGRKTMASLFAARRQNFAAPCSLHARAKTVRLVATAHFRLKRAFRQRTLPLSPTNWTESKRLV